MSALPAIQMIRDQDRAATALHPLRRRILESLSRPDSAAGVARRLDLPRQKVNYHLRLLERDGLVELEGERRAGNLTERVFRQAAHAYFIAPGALGPLAPSPEAVADRFSAAYLMAVAARALQDVGELEAAAREADKRLATLTLETEVRFATPERQSAFARELTEAVSGLVGRYHDETSPGGRTFRFVIGGYPARKRAPSAPAENGGME